MAVISDMNNEDPFGPNYDRKVCSQKVWTLYKNLSSSSQNNEQQTRLLLALKYFLGEGNV
ncbi:6036_t:CDS:2 [Ambispora gerdemannii]|uniref:6036_t:CDS:1 n=1 Tax=Ambispora gerdemannii TaxID=144530 RepID=A0A9N9D5T2_9GLOM|nr:6036_t:CDS:2 [Ambispora gerdemannii]